MATLTIWRADIDRALATSPKVYVRDAPQIHFVEPQTGLNLARANLSWDEVDDLIQQLTAIKAAEKPAKTLKELVDELEDIEYRLSRPKDIRGLTPERLNEQRLNLLSEIVKRLVE